MKKEKTTSDRLTDERLGILLKQNDPAIPLSRGAMLALETEIFTQIDRQAMHDDFSDDWVLARFFQPGWVTRAAVFVALLIMATGFMAGQLAYRPEPVASLSSVPSLLAFADDTSWSAVPVTSVSWGENDDE